VRRDLLSRNIKAARAEMGLTQEEVAHRARMQTAVYSRIERAEVDPRLSSIVRIAEALDVRLTLLVDDVDLP
jgi:transcriptional regulator with XRE-family HTH domain